MATIISSCAVHCRIKTLHEHRFDTGPSFRLESKRGQTWLIYPWIQRTHLHDCWQTAIEDVGPAGLDKGKGGKYLILPPGYNDKVPSGYFPLQTYTYEGYPIWFVFPRNPSPAMSANCVRANRSAV
jgi:hypothetical protein